ncbi:hypothetical protein AB0H92_31375 [Streptomyces phaeochromogenes]
MSDLRLEDTVFEDLKKTFSTISDRMDSARRDTDPAEHAEGAEHAGESQA